MIINYLGSNGATVFTTLVLMTGITAAIPYGFSALAQIKWRWIDHKTFETPRFVRDLIVAVISLIFSILFIVYSRNTGHSFWVYWAPFFLAGGALLLGIPVYRSQRRQCPRRGRLPALPVNHSTRRAVGEVYPPVWNDPGHDQFCGPLRNLYVCENIWRGCCPPRFSGAEPDDDGRRDRSVLPGFGSGLTRSDRPGEACDHTEYQAGGVHRGRRDGGGRNLLPARRGR